MTQLGLEHNLSRKHHELPYLKGFCDQDLKQPSVWVYKRGEPPITDASPDPDDNIFLAAAVEGEVDYIVSGDKKHLLSLGVYRGVRIITARQFVIQVLDASK